MNAGVVAPAGAWFPGRGLVSILACTVGVVVAAAPCPVVAFPIDVGDAAVAGFAAPLGAPEVAAAGGALPGGGATVLSLIAEDAAAAVSLIAAESLFPFEP